MQVEAITVDELEGRSGYSSVWGLAPFIFATVAAILSYLLMGLGSMLASMSWDMPWLEGPALLLQQMGSTAAYVIAYAAFFIAAVVALPSASRNAAGLNGRAAGLAWAPFALALLSTSSLAAGAAPQIMLEGADPSFAFHPEGYSSPWFFYSLAMGPAWTFANTLAIQGFVVLGLLHLGKHPMKAIVAALGFELLANVPTLASTAINSMQYGFYQDGYGAYQIAFGLIDTIVASLALSVLAVLTRSLTVVLVTAVAASVIATILRAGFF